MQFPALVFHAGENGLCFPLTTVFLGAAAMVQSSKQMLTNEKSGRDATAHAICSCQRLFPTPITVTDAREGSAWDTTYTLLTPPDAN